MEYDFKEMDFVCNCTNSAQSESQNCKPSQLILFFEHQWYHSLQVNDKFF